MIQVSTLPEQFNQFYANCYVTGLSVAAMDEKQRNYKELHGLAMGSATVVHQDWHEAMKLAAPTGHIWAECVDGRKFIGLIYPNRIKPGMIELDS